VRSGEPVLLRGFIDRVTIQVPAPETFVSLRALASLSGVSVKSLRRYPELPGHRALPCYRLPGAKIVIKISDWQAWVEQFRVIGRPGVDSILKDLGLRQSH
jgi:hypothetical protein